MSRYPPNDSVVFPVKMLLHKVKPLMQWFGGSLSPTMQVVIGRRQGDALDKSPVPSETSVRYLISDNSQDKGTELEK